MTMMVSLGLFGLMLMHIGAFLWGAQIVMALSVRRVRCPGGFAGCCARLECTDACALSLGAPWCLGPDTAARVVGVSGRNG